MPALASLDLSACTSLQYIFLQSASLANLSLSGCTALAKAVLQCPALDSVTLKGCTGLASILLWSDRLTSIDLGDSQVAFDFHQALGSRKISPLRTSCAPSRSRACRWWTCGAHCWTW
jgi:hypothetical protein